MGVRSPCLNMTTTLVRVRTFGSGGDSSNFGFERGFADAGQATKHNQMQARRNAEFQTILSFLSNNKKIKYQTIFYPTTFSVPFLHRLTLFLLKCIRLLQNHADPDALGSRGGSQSHSHINVADGTATICQDRKFKRKETLLSFSLFFSFLFSVFLPFVLTTLVRAQHVNRTALDDCGLAIVDIID